MNPSWHRLIRFWRPNVRDDVDAELQFHLEMTTRDLVAAGLTPEAARAEAERRFGELKGIRQDCVTIDARLERRTRRFEVVADLLTDLRFAARTLRRTPGFTFVAVLCVALGVGVTTTIFSATHAILIRPLPYQHADELVAIYARVKAKNATGINISYPDYVSWRDQSKTFARLGIWTWYTLAFSGGTGDPERVDASQVSANLFPLLGVRPLLGRGFTPDEEIPGNDRVVLLSHGLWRRRYGADPGIVGRAVTVDGLPYTVVGVMPPGFGFPDRGKAWVPFAVDPAQEAHGNRGYAGAIGRLKPGITLAQAQADLDAISARLQQEFLRENFGWDAEAIPLRQDLVGDLRRPLQVFLGAVGLVLLIVCANVANLMLARGAGRQREIALRVAIGAGRGRLIRQLLAESLAIALAGGALGAGLAVFGVRLFRLAFPDETPFYITLGMDGTALGFTLLLSVFTGVLFGTLPALRATRLDLIGALREGAPGAGDGSRKSRLRSSLVVAELALSLVLMIGAGLLIRSYRALTGTDLGFQERGILSMRVTLPEARYSARAGRAGFYQQLLERVRAIPGVEAAGSAQGIPFSGWNVQSEMAVEGQPPRRQGEELDVHYQYVTPDYFQTIGVPLVRGRWLTPADRDSVHLIGLINETLDRREFAGQDPVGRRMKYGRADSRNDWITIVGVVGDFRHYRLPQPMGPAIYLPYFANPAYSQTLVVRTSLPDPHALVPVIRGAIRELDPDLPAYSVQTFEEVVSRSLWRQRLQGQVLGLFAGLALLLASIGIYGVISYTVTQRTRELGVRTALGATRWDLIGLVLRQGAALALLGMALGVGAALALTRVLRTLLYGVGVTDLATFLLVPLALTLVALAASYVPARRAAKVDPLVAMRAE